MASSSTVYQSAQLLPCSRPQDLHFDHCNWLLFCHLSASSTRAIFSNCKCGQVSPFLITLPIISRLHFKNADDLHNLSSNSISKHCWPLAVTIPILQLSWAIWNFLKIPWSLMTPGCTTHSFLFLEAFPIWHVPNISFKTHFKYYFPWEAFSNSPRLLIFLLSLIFNLHIYLFTLEFLPFPLGKKCSINCFLSLILSFFICSPEYSTLLTAPRSVLWPCKKHSVNHVFKKKFFSSC